MRKAHHSLAGLLAGTVLLLTGSCGLFDPLALEREIDRLADLRVADLGAWEEVWTQTETPQQRRRVARGLGRLRLPDAVPLLARWLETEPDPGTRIELVFALGQCGDKAAVPVLLPRLEDAAHAIRARACEGLGKLRDPVALEPLVRHFEDPAGVVQQAALLAAARLAGRRAGRPEPLPAGVIDPVIAAATRRCSSPDPEIAWRAVYALSEIDALGREAAFTAALASEDPRARLFATRGLERIVPVSSALVELLIERLREDPNPHVAAATAAALGRMAARPSAAPPPSPATAAAPPPPLSSRLIAEVATSLAAAAERSEDPAHHHVRRAALLAAAGLAPSPADVTLRQAIERALTDPSVMVRAAALEAFARRHPEEAASHVQTRAASRAPLDRAAAAGVARHLSEAAGASLLQDLAGDSIPSVAAAALESMGEMPGLKEAALAAARRSLGSTDIAIVGSAIALLARAGSAADLPVLQEILAALEGTEWAEARVEAIRAFAALGKEAAEEHLQAALADPSPAVRRAARTALADLKLTPRQVAAAEGSESSPSSVAIESGQDDLRPTPYPRAALHTDRGTIILELLVDEAPRHVKGFLDRARAGAHDGLPIHRVVSGFVVQGLDPRGDGWGTGGIFLRDEINPVPYLAGAVGMPSSGPDTGGVQIFITHVPTPHLDGNYTVFARVVEGMDVVDRIDIGDVCSRVEVVE